MEEKLNNARREISALKRKISELKLENSSLRRQQGVTKLLQDLTSIEHIFLKVGVNESRSIDCAKAEVEALCRILSAPNCTYAGNKVPICSINFFPNSENI